MEGEINNLIVLWITVLSSLCYCHAIGKFIPKGTIRLLAILPIVCLFSYLPLNLRTVLLGATTSYIIAWLANFRLLLFALGKGPLSSNPPLPLSRFILIASVPIKIQDSPPKSEKPLEMETKEHPSHQTTKKGHKSPLNYIIKIMLLAILVRVYGYKEHIHPKLRLLLCCFHVYFLLDMSLAMLGALVRSLLVPVELEPPFDEPYLATSLQDFWGKRWNLMVPSILRPTVYEPVRSVSIRLVPRKFAALPSVLAVFLVSGVMHELLFYYFGRMAPTGEVTFFFILHGVCVAIEICIKKVLNGRFRLPPIVSGPLAIAFVLVTGVWLFFPPLLRFKTDVRICTESLAFIEFITHGRLVSPNEISCPFF